MAIYKTSPSDVHSQEQKRKLYSVGSSGTSPTDRARDARRNAVLAEMGITVTNEVPKTTPVKKTNTNTGGTTNTGGGSGAGGSTAPNPAAPTTVTPQIPGAPPLGNNPLLGRNKTRFKVNNGGVGSGTFNTLNLPGAGSNTPVGTALTSTAAGGSIVAANSPHAVKPKTFTSPGAFMQDHRSVAAGAAGQLPAASRTAGVPHYDASAATAGVVGTVPVQPKAKTTNTGGTGMPRIASGMSDYDIELRQNYIKEQEREDYLISHWPHSDKMSDYDISVRQNYIKDTPVLPPVFLNNISPTFAENNAKKQNYFDALDPQPETKHEQKGTDFSSGALPYFMRQNMPGGDILGKLSNYESGKIIYPKLAAALTTPTVSEPRETTIVQTELNNAQKRLAAKQQEIEDFYMQNRMILNAEGLFGSATDRHVEDVKMQQVTLRKELRDLEEQIVRLKEELFLARQNDWGAMAQNEDFEKYVQIGAEMKNPTWEDVNDPENIDPLSDPEERGKRVGNIVTFSMDNKDHLEYATKRDVGNAAYTYMTDEEVKIYNYLLGKYDKDTAQIYLDSLENTLNYRYGAEAAKQYTDIESPFWRTVASMPYAFAAGVDQFASGINQLFHEKKQPITPMQYASQAIQESLGTAGQIVYGVSNVVGNMLPSMLVGKGLGVLVVA